MESFPIGNDMIEVRRVEVRYGNDYSMPKLSSGYLSSDGTFHRVCVFYGNMVYDNIHTRHQWKVCVDWERRQSAADLEKRSRNVLWDTWFLKSCLDNRTGLIRYSVN